MLIIINKCSNNNDIKKIIWDRRIDDHLKGEKADWN